MRGRATTNGDLPSVSVVVAACNAAPVIADCINSLVALDYPADRLELIVVDNDSADDTADAVRAFGPRVVLLHEARRGPAAARNRGIAHGSGEVVAFTDADCVVDRRWLAELVAALSDPLVGIAGGRIQALRPCNKIAELEEELHDHDRAIGAQLPNAKTGSWASPRHVLEELSGFDETFLRCEDSDLSYRIIRAGYRIEYVENAVVFHRNRSTLWAVFRWAQLHGRGALRLRRIHADLYARMRPRQSLLRRTISALGRLRNVREPRRAVFRAVVDLGKISGELRGEL